MTSNNENKESIHIWDTPYRENGLNERNPAFECFLKYRDAGANRSLTDLADAEGIDYHKIRDWSSKYRWNHRIEEMLKHENEENKRLNAEIKKKAFNMAVKRQKMKNELIQTIFDVLKENALNYSSGDINLEFDKFVSFLNVAMKMESMNLDDMMQIEKVEQLFIDGGIDAKNIQALINNFNVVLTSENNDAIEKYEDAIRDDSY